jgi:hypothetical protein
MNADPEQQQQPTADATPENTAREQHEPIAEEQTAPAANEPIAEVASSTDNVSAETPATGNRRANKNRTRERNERKQKPKRTGPITKPIERFVVVTWSGQREPVDGMFWAEARREGEWVVIESLEQVRTRREVLERLIEMPSGLAALEFSFSYPQPFLEHISSELGDDRWRALLRKVREDLKKNTEDGIRLWIDRIGAYREANLDPDAPPVGRRMDDRRGGRFGRESNRPLAPHEQRSKAERFRRADLTIRHAAERHVVSPVQIAFNRLTGRYEFNDPAARGRAALLGMSVLEQLLEAREDVAVWPFMMPKALTVVELQPWIYTRGDVLKPDEVRRRLQVLEDAGWEISSTARDLAARNDDAQRALVSLIGIIRTESREDRANRPLRDYSEAFYADQQVKQEGWYYGVGYRSSEEKKKPRPERGAQNERKPRRERAAPAEDGTADNPIVSEASAVQIEATPEVNTGDPTASEVQAA